jgi:hypothetical protein
MRTPASRARARFRRLRTVPTQGGGDAGDRRITGAAGEVAQHDGQLLVGAQAAQPLPQPFAHDVVFECLLGPGQHIGQLHARGRDLPPLPDAHEADVAQDGMQPGPGRPGVAQTGQPQQGDDEGVLDRIERIGPVPEQPDSGCVQRWPASLEQDGQGLHVPTSCQRAQLRV